MNNECLTPIGQLIFRAQHPSASITINLVCKDNAKHLLDRKLSDQCNFHYSKYGGEILSPRERKQTGLKDVEEQHIAEIWINFFFYLTTTRQVECDSTNDECLYSLF